MMRRKRTKYRIVWEGKQYEIGITAVAKLTDKSRTFIVARLEEGLTMQQAIDAVPNDPSRKKKRRTEPLRDPDQTQKRNREHREKLIRIEHRDLFANFFRGKPCSH